MNHLTTPLRYLVLLLLLSFTGTLAGQFYAEPFAAGANGYQTADFQWQADGAADIFAGWGPRTRVQSASRGGAIVYEGPGTTARLTSPPIPLPFDGSFDLYLSFYQYFAAEGGGRPRLVISNDLGAVLDTTLTLDIGLTGETQSGSYHLLNLSGELGTEGSNLTIEFSIDLAASQFWILDDITLYRQRPEPVSFPRRYGEALNDFGIPFIVDSLGAPAVPFQLVADILPGFDEAEVAVFRDMIDATVVRSCACDRIEVWEMPGGVFFDPDTGTPLGDPAEILSRTLPGSGMNKVDGLDLNYYVFNELLDQPDQPNAPLTEADLAGLSPAPADAVRVAVLDTGLDLDHPDVFGYLFRDPDAPGNGLDEDDDCLTDNPLGWNYVDENNNPNDDNGHGTHVSGVITQNLNLCDTCVVQLIPYKTHDEHGVGTIFNAACATLQAAVNDDADVINASWGFYGGGSTVLRNAIDTAAAYGALFVAAAGNDTLFMDVDPQFPALYGLDNIVGVAAHDTTATGDLPPAGFTNFSATRLPLAAFGVDVLSALPGGIQGLKSGTSQATPAVSAAACLYNCENGPTPPVEVRDFLLDNARTDANLTITVDQQRALDPTVFCERDPQATADNPLFFYSACFDRATEVLDVRALQNLGPTTVEVFLLTGGVAGRASDASLVRGQSLTVDLSRAPAGEYLIVVTCRGRTFTQRLVKR